MNDFKHRDWPTQVAKAIILLAASAVVLILLVWIALG